MDPKITVLAALVIVSLGHVLATPLASARQADPNITTIRAAHQEPLPSPASQQQTQAVTAVHKGRVEEHTFPPENSTSIAVAMGMSGVDMSTAVTGGAQLYNTASGPSSKPYMLPQPVLIRGLRAEPISLLASLVERLSAIVEAAGSGHALQSKMLQGTSTLSFRQKSKDRAATFAQLKAPGQLVVFLPAPPVASQEVHANSVVRIHRAEFRNGVLNLVLCERDPAQTTSHSIQIGDHKVDVQGIRAQRIDQNTYELKIRALLDTSVSIHKPDTSVVSLSREQLLESRAFHPQVEDETEFIQTQIKCTAMSKGNGLNASLCTCEAFYHDDLNGQILCVSRIADRVVNYAKRKKQNDLAQTTFDKALHCRSFGASEAGQDPRIAQKVCLTAVLQAAVDDSPEVASRQARQLLSAKEEVALSTKPIGLTENSGMNGSDRALLPAPRLKFQIRLVVFVVYLLAVSILVLGFGHVAKHYSRYSHGSWRRTDFVPLPDHARRLSSQECYGSKI